jgi:transposase
VLLFTDWTLLRLFPPLRAMWAAIGTQAKVAITGQNAKRVLFGTINVRTAHRTVYIGRRVGTHDVQAFLLALRKAYQRAGTIWRLADRASGHTAAATLALAKELRIEFVWLPRQWPELNAMDQLWKALKHDVAANRQATSIDNLAERACQWVLNLTPAQARRTSGMASSKFWLRSLLQHIWQPTVVSREALRSSHRYVEAAHPNVWRNSRKYGLSLRHWSASSSGMALVPKSPSAPQPPRCEG